MILVDSNVLIDIAEADTTWGDWSEQQFAMASGTGALAINAVVYAEIARSYAGIASIDAFLAQFGVALLDIPREAAFRASRAHLRYRRAGGSRVATLPDFFIAAHAACIGAKLLTRDATRARTYFPDLSVIAPA